MEPIYKIYENKIGISFQWRKGTKLTQVIFRDTGFHLSKQEIEVFINKVKYSRLNRPCSDCKLGDNYRSLLLQTPLNKVSVAVSLNELGEIEDLFRGTIFQLELTSYLDSVCKN